MSTVNVFFPTRILSSANAPDLLNWTRESLDTNYHHLLINLNNVLFMDSIGLTALITARGMVLEAGGKLGVCGLTGQARMLFEMTNMEQIFEIYETAAEFQQAITSSRELFCTDQLEIPIAPENIPI